MTKATGMLKHTVFICPIKVTVICFAFNWRNQSDLEIIEYIFFPILWRNIANVNATFRSIGSV